MMMMGLNNVESIAEQPATSLELRFWSLRLDFAFKVETEYFLT